MSKDEEMSIEVKKECSCHDISTTMLEDIRFPSDHTSCCLHNETLFAEFDELVQIEKLVSVTSTDGNESGDEEEDQSDEESLHIEEGFMHDLRSILQGLSPPSDNSKDSTPSKTSCNLLMELEKLKNTSSHLPALTNKIDTIKHKVVDYMLNTTPKYALKKRGPIFSTPNSGEEMNLSCGIDSLASLSILGPDEMDDDLLGHFGFSKTLQKSKEDEACEALLPGTEPQETIKPESLDDVSIQQKIQILDDNKTSNHQPVEGKGTDGHGEVTKTSSEETSSDCRKNEINGEIISEIDGNESLVKDNLGIKTDETFCGGVFGKTNRDATFCEKIWTEIKPTDTFIEEPCLVNGTFVTSEPCKPMKNGTFCEEPKKNGTFCQEPKKDGTFCEDPKKDGTFCEEPKKNNGTFCQDPPNLVNNETYIEESGKDIFEGKINKPNGTFCKETSLNGTLDMGANSTFTKNKEKAMNVTVELPSKDDALNTSCISLGKGQFEIEGHCTNLMDMESGDLQKILASPQVDGDKCPKRLSLQKPKKKRSLMKRLSMNTSLAIQATLSDDSGKQGKIALKEKLLSNLPGTPVIKLKKPQKIEKKGPMKAVAFMQAFQDTDNSDFSCKPRAVSTPTAAPLEKRTGNTKNEKIKETCPSLGSFGSVSTIDSDKPPSFEIGTPEVFSSWKTNATRLTSTPAVLSDLICQLPQLNAGDIPTPIVPPQTKMRSRQIIQSDDEDSVLVEDFSKKLKAADQAMEQLKVSLSSPTKTPSSNTPCDLAPSTPKSSLEMSINTKLFERSPQRCYMETPVSSRTLDKPVSRNSSASKSSNPIQLSSKKPQTKPPRNPLQQTSSQKQAAQSTKRTKCTPTVPRRAKENAPPVCDAKLKPPRIVKPRVSLAPKKIQPTLKKSPVEPPKPRINTGLRKPTPVGSNLKGPQPSASSGVSKLPRAGRIPVPLKASSIPECSDSDAKKAKASGLPRAFTSKLRPYSVTKK